MKFQGNLHNNQRPITFLAADCQRNKVIFGNTNTINIIWNCKDDIQPQQIEHYPYPRSITCAALNPQGTIAMIGEDTSINFIDLTVNPLQLTFETINTKHEGSIACIAFRQDGTKAISLCNRNILILWDLNEKTVTFEKELQLMRSCAAVVMVPDESKVVFSVNTYVVVYDFSTSEPIRLYSLSKKHEAAISCLASDLTNHRVFSGSHDQTINIWQIGKTYACFLQTIKGPQAAISCLALTPDGSLLLSADRNYTIKMWRLNSLPHECITRALEKCSSDEKDPLYNLPDFAKRNIYKLLYKKLQHPNAIESKSTRRKFLKSELMIHEMSESELMSWGDDIFRETTFMQEKKDSVEAYRDCLKFPRYFTGPPSLESMV